MDLFRLRKLAGIQITEDLDVGSDTPVNDRLPKDDAPEDDRFDKFSSSVKDMGFIPEREGNGFSIYLTGTLGFRYNFEDETLEVYDESGKVVNSEHMSPDEALEFIESQKTDGDENDDIDTDAVPSDSEEGDMDADKELGNELDQDQMGESEILEKEEDPKTINFNKGNKETSYSTKDVDTMEFNKSKEGVDTEQASKVKTPRDVMAQIDRRIGQLKKSIEEYDNNGFDEGSLKQDAIDALEKFKGFLSKNNLEGYKEAQILYGTFMNGITELFPTKLVNFLFFGKGKKAENVVKK